MKGVAAGNRYGSVPGGAVIRGVGGDKASGSAPGNIHAPIEWGGRVVVSPTRFAIVVAAHCERKNVSN